MKPINLSVLLSVLLFFLFGTVSAGTTEKEPVDYVNPYMGNISHLLVPTFPTIHLPNSLLRVYPSRRDYTGDVLSGLPLIVTSHRGRSAFNLSPFQGSEQDFKPVIKYSYDHEKITPYFYSVYLDDQEINVEYAVSHQAALYEIRFEKKTPPYLLLNSHAGELKWAGNAISGNQALANGTKVYIYLEPEIEPENVAALVKNKVVDKKTASGRNACLVLKFNENTPVLRVRYGISFIDAQQAKKNLYREVADFDLSTLRQTGRDVWNVALGKISVEGGSEDDKTVFYT